MICRVNAELQIFLVDPTKTMSTCTLFGTASVRAWRDVGGIHHALLQRVRYAELLAYRLHREINTTLPGTDPLAHASPSTSIENVMGNGFGRNGPGNF